MYCCCARPAFQAAAAGIDTKEAELRQVRTRIESIRKEIHADAERRDALTGQLKRADLQIQSARERLAEVRARRIDSEQKLAGLKAEQARDAARSRGRARASSRAELKVAYMNGRQEQLKLLLNQRDPAALGRMMAYYGYFGRARAERITSITEHLAHLELLSERHRRGNRAAARARGGERARREGSRRRARAARADARRSPGETAHAQRSAGAGCSRTRRRWRSWSNSCGARSRNFPSWRSSRSSA